MILVQIGKYRGERFTAVQNIRRFVRSAVHEDVEYGIFGKQIHLACGVSPVGAVELGSTRLGAGEGVSAKSICEKSGIWVIAASDPCIRQLI